MAQTIESLTLAAFGGMLGILAAVLLTTTKIDLSGMGEWSDLAIDLTITPSMLATSLVTVVLVGFIGGMSPALRAMRISPLDALRS